MSESTKSGSKNRKQQINILAYMHSSGVHDDEQLSANWNTWEKIQQCTLWKAIALSLDIEPPKKWYFVRGWPVEYENRLDIATIHFECKNLLPSKIDSGSVDLTTFRAWAESLGWSLPERFPRGAKLQAKALIEALPITQAVTVNCGRPIKQQRFQEKEILRVIGELGFDPKDIPKWVAGKSGIKAKVRDRLVNNTFSTNVFNKAWERLRASKDIQEK